MYATEETGLIGYSSLYLFIPKPRASHTVPPKSKFQWSTNVCRLEVEKVIDCSIFWTGTVWVVSLFPKMLFIFHSLQHFVYLPSY